MINELPASEVTLVTGVYCTTVIGSAGVPIRNKQIASLGLRRLKSEYGVFPVYWLCNELLGPGISMKEAMLRASLLKLLRNSAVLVTAIAMPLSSQEALKKRTDGRLVLHFIITPSTENHALEKYTALTEQISRLLGMNKACASALIEDTKECAHFYLDVRPDEIGVLASTVLPRVLHVTDVELV